MSKPKKHKRKKSKRSPKCTMCTKHKWYGNSEGRRSVADKRRLQEDERKDY